MIDAVFLDRDGVINEEVNLLSSETRLRLVPRSSQAIRRLNDCGIRTVVITNQSAVARNLCTEEDVIRIHEKLKEMLYRESSAEIDEIYYCPHHPETHHRDGNPAYRIRCTCRKPEIGLLQEAARRFTLRLSHCLMIGDQTRDIQTGINAGSKTILVKTGYGGRDGKYPVTPNAVAGDLMGAVNLFTGVEQRKELTDSRELARMLVARYLTDSGERFLISIGGCSRSGKTVLASELSHSLEGMGVPCIAVSLDNWLVSHDRRSPRSSVRQRFDCRAIVRACTQLKQGRPVFHPVYDARRRRRIRERSPEPLQLDKGIIIVDGVISLDVAELRELSDMTVYTDVDDTVRRQRLREFYIRYKDCTERESDRIIASREAEEIPLIRATRRFADVTFTFPHGG
jgi:histidinol-phosphate phosphatase family protein